MTQHWQTTDDEYRAWVATDFKRDPHDLIFEIYKEALNEKQESAGRISKTVAKASTLLARLSADQERVHRGIRAWTISLFVLTAVLTVFTGVLIYYTAKLVQHEQQPHQNTPQASTNAPQQPKSVP
jgi:hypothetical protein